MSGQMVCAIAGLVIAALVILCAWADLYRKRRLRLNIKGFILGLAVFFLCKYLLVSAVYYGISLIPFMDSIGKNPLTAGMLDAVLLSAMMVLGFLAAVSLFYKKRFTSDDMLSLSFGCVAFDLCAIINNLSTAAIYCYRIGNGTFDAYMREHTAGYTPELIAALARSYVEMDPAFLIFTGLSAAMIIGGQLLLVGLLRKNREERSGKTVGLAVLSQIVFYLIYAASSSNNSVLAVIGAVLYTAFALLIAKRYWSEYGEIGEEK